MKLLININLTFEIRELCVIYRYFQKKVYIIFYHLSSSYSTDSAKFGIIWHCVLDV